MRRIILQAAVILLCAAPLARATNFAILLGTDGKNEAVVSFDFKTPVLDITGMTVSFDPADLPAGASPPADAFMFAMSLRDNADDHVIHQFAHPVQVNFAVTKTPKVSDFGMSRLLETTSPPTWIVQDASLTTKDGPYLCGKTDHFSYFALTPLSSVPEPAAAGLLLGCATLATRRARRRA